MGKDKIRQHCTVRTDDRCVYLVIGENGFEHTKVVVGKDKDALKKQRWVNVVIEKAKGTFGVSTMV